ncbi:hypothetical protein SAMN04487949_3010 [Halogranum gelatinilyticum]|uniref:Uncharacterized protein n=1 Tax=Halogranum gelatinilyticum TaxID=660521 RepID=A0A1G9XIU8_9EURY|nr:hypothetical protein [Halogranum gelatinilyticum]SDM96674.1 hypothetical protein SAMN04487949_3010 [Halogranum gelatinilyticum]
MSDSHPAGRSSASPASPAQSTASDAPADARRDGRLPEANEHSPPESTWGPTRLGSGLVLLGTLLVTALLVTATGLTTPVGVGVGGSLALAAALWCVARDRFRLPATLAGSLLLLPAGVGLAVGVGYTLLQQLNGSVAVGSVFVVAGLTVGGFGAAAAVRDVLTTDALRRLTAVTAATLGIPLVAFLGLAAASLLPLTPAGEVADGLTSAAEATFIRPTPADEPHLISFAVLLVAAAVAARWALNRLPLAELTPDETVETVTATVAALDRTLLWSGFGGLLLAFVGVVAAIPSDPVFSRLPAAVTTLLAVVSNAPSLRWLFVTIAAASLLAVGVLAALRRAARVDERTRSYVVAVAGGGLLVAAASADPAGVVDALFATVLELLPTELATEFDSVATSVVEFYGPQTVVLGLLVGALVVTAWVTLGLVVGGWLGFLSGRAAAAGVAGSGLFVAATLAKTVGVSAPLVLGCLVASLAVWDAGEYAVGLGREVGRRAPTRQTELVHVAGSLLVGALAAGAVLALARSVPRLAAGSETPVLLALAAAVAGVVSLVVALR